MKTAFLPYHILGLMLALPMGASAATVIVNGAADNPGVSYQTLSGAVNYLQGLGAGPHTVDIVVDSLPTPDGQVVINTEMTINGDADNNGNKADILVDIPGIEAAAHVGETDAKCYIEVSGTTATISDLKIHPNADTTGAGTGTAIQNSVDGIRIYEPAAGLVPIILNRVWVSGSDISGNYVDLATSSLLYDSTPFKWSVIPASGTIQSGNNAVIHVQNRGGNADVQLNNCMAGLGKSNALNINSRGGSTVVTGGLYGHVARDGIRVVGNGVTLTGSPTNRLRVVRSTSISGSDAHGVEIYGASGAAATVSLMSYVDVAGMNTSQLFKVWGSGGNATVTLMEYCRGLGKLSANGTENNPAMLVNEQGRITTMRHTTIVGAAGSSTTVNPYATDPSISRDLAITDCIFTSENLGVINLANTDSLNGVTSFDNSAVPTDLVTSESLNNTTPITGVTSTYPAPVNITTVSPNYIQTLAAYDWSEAAVSIDGSNTAAGNPNVLRPSNAAYATAGTAGAPLVGGAGPVLSAVHDWSIY